MKVKDKIFKVLLQQFLFSFFSWGKNYYLIFFFSSCLTKPTIQILSTDEIS